MGITKGQRDLLLHCVDFMRTADTLAEELVEIVPGGRHHQKTVQSLLEMGLLVEDMPAWATTATNRHVRFPTTREMAARQDEDKKRPSRDWGKRRPVTKPRGD